MRLVYSNAKLREVLGGKGNFGDDLNPYFFQEWVKGASDFSTYNISLYAIGSLLNPDLTLNGSNIVFGTGSADGRVPSFKGRKLKCYFVRGPLTAERMGNGIKPGIDPAYQLANTYSFDQPKRYALAYMPHCYEAHSHFPLIERVCKELGILLIDPREPVDKILLQLAQTEKLLTEAMHGAIVADAFRIPWTNIRFNGGIQMYKWTDFAQSVKLTFNDNRVRRLVSLKKYLPFYSFFDYQNVKKSIALLKNGNFYLSSDTIWNEQRQFIDEQFKLLHHDLTNKSFLHESYWTVRS